jgi:hypothetical protein
MGQTDPSVDQLSFSKKLAFDLNIYWILEGDIIHTAYIGENIVPCIMCEISTYSTLKDKVKTKGDIPRIPLLDLSCRFLTKTIYL